MCKSGTDFWIWGLVGTRRDDMDGHGCEGRICMQSLLDNLVPILVYFCTVLTP